MEQIFLLLANESMTRDTETKDKLIYLASWSIVPVVVVLIILSDPANLTKDKWLECTSYLSLVQEIDSIVIIKIKFDLVVVVPIFVDLTHELVYN